MKHIPKRGGGNIRKYLEVGTASVDLKVDTTKSGYITFDPGGMSTIDYRALYQESESNKACRGETNKSTNTIL